MEKYQLPRSPLISLKKKKDKFVFSFLQKFLNFICPSHDTTSNAYLPTEMHPISCDIP